MRTKNVILLTAIAAAVGGGLAWRAAASGEPAVYEVRNAQPNLDLIEFKVEGAGTSIPSTQPGGPEMVRQNIRICTDDGVPVPQVLVEWYQRYGEVYVKKDECRTSAEGMCMIEVEVEANGKIQVTQQLSKAVRFVRRTAAAEIGPCATQATQ